jgi:hypothetical protein
MAGDLRYKDMWQQQWRGSGDLGFIIITHLQVVGFMKWGAQVKLRFVT